MNAWLRRHFPWASLAAMAVTAGGLAIRNYHRAWPFTEHFEDPPGPQRWLMNAAVWVVLICGSGFSAHLVCRKSNSPRFTLAELLLFVAAIAVTMFLVRFDGHFAVWTIERTRTHDAGVFYLPLRAMNFVPRFGPTHYLPPHGWVGVACGIAGTVYSIAWLSIAIPARVIRRCRGFSTH